MSFDELYRALAERDFISASQPVPEPDGEAAASPWYVQVFVGAGAWLAGIFMLAFLVIELRDTFSHGRVGWGFLLALGLTSCAGASLLYAIAGARSVFAAQFALAMSFAGQFGIAFGLGDLGGAHLVCWGMLIVEITLVVAMRNHLHRLLSSLAAVVAWALAVHQLFFGDLSLNPLPPGASGVLPIWQLPLSVLIWLLVWAPVVAAARWLVRHEGEWMARGRDIELRPVTHGLIAAISVAPLALHPNGFWVILLGLGPVGSHPASPDNGWLALWPLLAALLALPAMALAFALCHRPLVGLAILFGLLEISCFYYVLGATLLFKSLVMVALGLLLLAACHWMEKRWA